jgi:hypothetical protein
VFTSTSGDPSHPKCRPAGPTERVDHLRTALLSEGRVRVRVEAGCPAGLEVLEALVTVSQETAFGEAPISAACTGQTRRSWVT